MFCYSLQCQHTDVYTCTAIYSVFFKKQLSLRLKWFYVEYRKSFFVGVTSNWPFCSIHTCDFFPFMIALALRFITPSSRVSSSKSYRTGLIKKMMNSLRSIQREQFFRFFPNEWNMLIYHYLQLYTCYDACVCVYVFLL